MLQEEEFRPHWIYNLVFRPSIRYFSINDRLLLTESSQQTSISFADIQEIKLDKGFFLDSISVLLANGGNFQLEGLSRNNADRAHRMLRHGKLYESIQKEWPSYERAHDAWRSLCACVKYVSNSQCCEWLDAYGKLPLPSEEEISLFKLSDKVRVEIISDLCSAVKRGRKIITDHNESFVKQELTVWKQFFDSIETHPLTDRQRLSVIHDEDHNLVVAGAGTGKTSAIIAKVGYIIKKELALPAEILLLSFTGKAAQEMRDRISEKIQIELNVRTFHSLGCEIIAQVTDKKPSLCKEAVDEKRMQSNLIDILQESIKNQKFRENYIMFQTMFWAPYKADWEFKTLSEYINYLNNNNIRRSLSGDLVKSFEECLIANWLYSNGIRFEYEARYCVDVATRNHRQYTPDFYLPDGKIYIEHFGIDREGNTAPFIEQQRYIADMDWKRSLHQMHGTRLIETYSWEHKEGTLLSGLKRKLLHNGVVLKPIPQEEILQKINELGRNEPLVKLFATFKSLFKGNGFRPAGIYEKAKDFGEPARSRTFLDLFFVVHEGYEKRNMKNREIDFDDMISKANEHVISGRYVSPFKYILVDEFQDISVGRATLLTVLRDQLKGARLFCVGDDWQSIYRFTGSDIGLMTKYAEFFGYTKRIDLNRTFRFNDKIESFSTRFILQNPSQLQKELLPHTTIKDPAIIMILSKSGGDCLKMILSEIEKGCDKKASVFILERYNFQKPSADLLDMFTKEFPKLHISSLTAHSSKGLEADYVIVDNLTGGTYGFPSEISDDPLLNLVLSEPEQYSNGEERRLFYVAVSRAKKKVYLVSDAAVRSSFVQELIDDKGYDVIVRGDAIGGSLSRCPTCGSGTLVSRTQESSGKHFWGCSNYPLCDHTEEACPKCQQGHLIIGGDLSIHCSKCVFEGRLCPQCKKGRLEKRKGRYGYFWGCSMYKSRGNQCTYTKNIS